ncbi:hypothetical protein A8144_12820 [Mycobacterium leprae 3125609]|nr:hypothetical protein [Mycobacterium leprae]OAR19921.1 hypothetical protein A8144_12820 [Mycobacterium leprae 3125609]OAX70084.1 hypothetical protein A3216_14125 [Mycobacterium leprae 7935681]
MRVCSCSDADTAVAQTQPSEYAQYSAAATAAGPVSVNIAISTAAAVSHVTTGIVLRTKLYAQQP